MGVLSVRGPAGHLGAFAAANFFRSVELLDPAQVAEDLRIFVRIAGVAVGLETSA